MDEEIKQKKEKEQYKYNKTTPTFKRTTEFTKEGEIVREETRTVQGERREKGTFFQKTCKSRKKDAFLIGVFR